VEEMETEREREEIEKENQATSATVHRRYEESRTFIFVHFLTPQHIRKDLLGWSRDIPSI